MIYDNYLLYVLGTIDGYTIKVKKAFTKAFYREKYYTKRPPDDYRWHR